MKGKVVRIHQPTRPLEYVACFNFRVSTIEGPGYVYCAVDGYSQFAFMTGVEPNVYPESILKHVRLLIRHPDFLKHVHKGFTLVFSKHEGLADAIRAIISSRNGRLLYDASLHMEIISPMLTDLRLRFGRIDMDG